VTGRLTGVRAVVFDFDGLILDTETPLARGWAEVYASYGCQPLTPAEWGAAIGTAVSIDPVAILLGRAGAAGLTIDPGVAGAAGRDAVSELIAAEVVRPGVQAWLDEADRRHLATAVASSSPVSWVGGHLDRLGLLHRFQALACARPGVAAKPAPDLYLEACAALGVHTAQALAVEDSPNGIAAARAAGLACVAVPNELTRQLDLAGADLVVASLAEVSLGEVLARL
jgi:HAD superfamily hydrolase (TIGR01509 family)